MSKFAIIGDIHSSKKDLKAVLQHVRKVDPQAEVVGTGDIFECTISKKKLPLPKPLPYEQVYKTKREFEQLLTFPTVYGNQEERILLVGEGEDEWPKWMRRLPEVYPLSPDAAIIHGHQWEWGGTPWALQNYTMQGRLTFYGHSHTSLFNRQPVQFGHPYDVSTGEHLINVGSDVDNREWVLYEVEEGQVLFMKA